MSIIPPISTPATPGSAEVIYPCSDGRPVGETPVHRDNLLYTIEILEEWFAAEPFVYASGNMFLYYEKGNKRKHVSPDVFVVRGVRKDKRRKAYLLWEEGRAPDMVIEITSESTRGEDTNKKLKLYRDVLKVTEYFLFDPFREYVGGQLQGFRLRKGKYEPIASLAGRLPSDVIGLHLEADGEVLRLWDPKTRRRLPNVKERARAAKAEAQAAAAEVDAERKRADTERKRADEHQTQMLAEKNRADEQQAQMLAEKKRADARALADQQRAEEKDLEIERLRREIESLRHPPPDA